MHVLLVINVGHACMVKTWFIGLLFDYLKWYSVCMHVYLYNNAMMDAFVFTS